MINVGVVGLGVGRHHAWAAQCHPEARVIRLCDLDQSVLDAVSDQYPDAIASIDPMSVIEDPAVDLVSIASYDDVHAIQVLAALGHGKHVFVEKPICLFPEEASRIRAALNQSPGLQLSTNLGLRTCPRFAGVKEAVLSGDMGSIYHMEGEYLWGRPARLTDGWRKAMPFYSIIYGAAVHMVDLLLWIAGELPVAVRGLGSKVATKAQGMRFDDFAVFLLEYASGMTAKVSAHGGCVHPHFHRLAVYGTEKTFCNDLSGAIWLDSSDPRQSPRFDELEYPAREHRNDVMKSFLDSVLYSDSEPLVSEHDAFDCMAVCFAAERAIKENKTILIDYAF